MDNPFTSDDASNLFLQSRPERIRIERLALMRLIKETCEASHKPTLDTVIHYNENVEYLQSLGYIVTYIDWANMFTIDWSKK